MANQPASLGAGTTWHMLEPKQTELPHARKTSGLGRGQAAGLPLDLREQKHRLWKAQILQAFT